jgi:UPF0716 family protein affecting phage T7 exclusion
VIFLAGEWVGAWLGMSITFLVAALGVVGLGWWVVRGSARNRAAEPEAEIGAIPEHEGAHSKSAH